MAQRRRWLQLPPLPVGLFLAVRAFDAEVLLL
jgi:hypothetical protein